MDSQVAIKSVLSFITSLTKNKLSLFVISNNFNSSSFALYICILGAVYGIL
ncbi:hypothetical protein [Clostridium tertium]